MPDLKETQSPQNPAHLFVAPQAARLPSEPHHFQDIDGRALTRDENLAKVYHEPVRDVLFLISHLPQSRHAHSHALHKSIPKYGSHSDCLEPGQAIPNPQQPPLLRDFYAHTKRTIQPIPHQTYDQCLQPHDRSESLPQCHLLPQNDGPTKTNGRLHFCQRLCYQLPFESSQAGPLPELRGVIAAK